MFSDSSLDFESRKRKGGVSMNTLTRMFWTVMITLPFEHEYGQDRPHGNKHVKKHRKGRYQ
jgi:hypothetical protein